MLTYVHACECGPIVICSKASALSAIHCRERVSQESLAPQTIAVSSTGDAVMSCTPACNIALPAIQCSEQMSQVSLAPQTIVVSRTSNAVMSFTSVCNTAVPQFRR